MQCKTATTELSSGIIVNRDLNKDDKQQKISAILSNIRSMKHSRHQAFFDASIELMKLGLSLPEVEKHCYEIAGSEAKMINKVPGIMSSLSKY